MTAVLQLRVDVDAPPEAVFAAATDWEGQQEWMVGTVVRPTRWRGHGEGGRLTAVTRLGPLVFADPMEVTLWDPPRAAHVRHLGRVVRGTGAFEVEPRGDGSSTFVWREELELPLGLLGRVGWPLVRPVAAALVRRSLEEFARWTEAGRPRAAG